MNDEAGYYSENYFPPHPKGF